MAISTAQDHKCTSGRVSRAAKSLQLPRDNEESHGSDFAGAALHAVNRVEPSLKFVPRAAYQARTYSSFTAIGRRLGKPSSALLYLGQGACGVSLSMVSPTLVQAQRSWPMSYAQTSLYPSLLAASMILAGMAYARCTTRWGRRHVLTAAAGLSAASALGVAIAESPAALLVAVVALGLFSAAVQAGVMSTLADIGPNRRARRLTLGTLCASLGSLIGPSLVALVAGTPLGWHRAWWMLAPVFVVLGLVLPRADHHSMASTGDARQYGKLPRRYWLLAIGVALGVAGEICLVYFAPQEVTRSGLSYGGLVVLPYYLGELTGRAASTVATTRGAAEERILGLALLFALLGFGTFWLASPTSLRLVGMFIAGLGIGNFFPLGASIVSSVAPGAADRAMSRLTLLVGITALLTPLVLGEIADQAGAHVALALIPLLCLGVAATALTRQRRWSKVGRSGLTHRFAGGHRSPELLAGLNES